MAEAPVNNRNSQAPNSMREGEPSIGTIVKDRITKRVGLVESIKIGGWRTVRYANGETQLRRSGNLAYANPQDKALLDMRKELLNKEEAKLQAKKRPKPAVPRPQRKKQLLEEFAPSEPSKGKVVRIKDTGVTAVVVEVRRSGWRILRTKTGDEDIVKRPADLVYATGRSAAAFPVEDVQRRYDFERVDSDEDSDDEPRRCLPNVGDTFAALGKDGLWRRGIVSSMHRSEDDDGSDDDDFQDLVLTLRFEDGTCADELWPPLAERPVVEVANKRVPRCISRAPKDLVGYTLTVRGRPGAVVGFASRTSRSSPLFHVQYDDDDSVAEVGVNVVRAALLKAEQGPYDDPVSHRCTRRPLECPTDDDDDDTVDDDPLVVEEASGTEEQS